MTYLRRWRKAWILLALIACFVVPWWIARWVYFHHTVPARTNQHGILITPPFSIHAITWMPVRTNLHETALPTHQWVLLYFYPAHCGASCHRDWHLLGQIQRSLGKDENRVARLLVVYPETPLTRDQRQALSTTPVQLHMRAVNPYPWRDLMRAQFNQLPKKGTIFITDPHGNVILMYPPYTPMEHVRKDLQKLLDLSQIG